MTFWKTTQFSPIGLDLASTAVRGVQLWCRGETLGVHSGLEIKFDPVTLGNDEAESMLSMMHGHARPELSIAKSLSGTEPKNTGKETSSDDAALSQTEEILRDAIIRLMHLGGFRGRDVMIHCPVENLDMRPVSLPSGAEGLPRDTILGVLRHQLADLTSFAIDQAVIDYYVLGYDERAKELEVMAFVADGGWIEKQILLLRTLGLNCVGVDPMPFTLSRLASLPSQRSACEPETPQGAILPVGSSVTEELIALLDIGYTGTTLVVMRGKNPVFCRRFSLGGKEMTKWLSQHLMIDPVQAEKLKVAYGFCFYSEILQDAPDNQPSRESLRISKTIFTALQSKLDEFIEGVIRSLNYVISQQRNVRMTKLLLSGTASHTRHLNSYLAEKLEIPVEHLSQEILSEILQSLPLSRATSGSWCIATSLALASFMKTVYPHSTKDSSAGSIQKKVDAELLEVR